MVCPKCKSGALSTVPAEIRLYRNGPRTMSHPPFSPQPDIHICLDCGNAEFAVPEKWLAAGWFEGGYVDLAVRAECCTGRPSADAGGLWFLAVQRKGPQP